MKLLGDWEGGTASLAPHRSHGLAETKPPSSLLCANCEDEKSLLKVICSKQQGVKSQMVVKGHRGCSVSGVKARLVQSVTLGLGKKGFLGRAGSRLDHPWGLEKC